MRQNKSSRSPTSLHFLEKLKIFVTPQRKRLSQDTLLEREKVTRNFPGSLWYNNMPSTYSAWYDKIPSVLRTGVHHQKGMVIVPWDFTNLNWKISLFKLLYILETITLKFSYFWLLSQQDKSKLSIREFFCPYKLFGHICISSLGWGKNHSNGTTFPHLFPKCVHCEGLLTHQAVTTTWIRDHLQILHRLGDFNLIHKQPNKIKREK